MIVVGPLGAMILLARSWLCEFLFWLNLFVWCSVTIYFAFEEDLTVNSWEKILLALSVVWAIAGAMITIGSLPWIPFSKEASKRIHGISFLMDFRLLLGLLMLTAAIGTAIFRALIQEIPILHGLTLWELPNPRQKGFLAAALLPFIQIFNILLVVLHAIVELFWKALQLLVIFFGRIGSHLMGIFKKLAIQIPAWINTGRSLLVLSLVIIVFWLLENTAPNAYAYMCTSLWRQQIGHLALLIFKTAMILVCIWIIAGIITKGVRLILRSKLGKMTVDEKRPEMLPAIAQDERSKCKNSLTAINGPSHA